MTPPSIENGFSGARVLITGGLGFIGSNLARRMADLGAAVTVMDPLLPQMGGNPFNLDGYEDRVDVHSVDLRDRSGSAALLRGKDFVFNLAGQVSHLYSMEDPLSDLDINVLGQLTFLESCRRVSPKAKVVFAGTRQVYGPPRRLPVKETHSMNPVDVNAVNKLAAECYHLLYHRVYGLRTSVLRLTNTYGPRMRVRDSLKTFIGLWVRQILDGEEITVYGDGSPLRDMLYVDDAVEAFLFSALHDSSDGRVYNVGSDETVSLMELAQLMIEVNGGGRIVKIPYPADRKKIDIGSYASDIAKIGRELGWKPATRLRDGMASTLDYYRRNRDLYW
jgi:nucleoside-diphosphate-sugar epimerase